MRPPAPSPSSTSPRRARAARQLLDQLGVRHELLLADARRGRRGARSRAAPARRRRAYVRARDARSSSTPPSRACARAACRRRRCCAPTPPWRSAARILGKPADAADAARMLRAAVGPHAPRADRGRGAARAARALRALSVSRVRFAPIDAARRSRLRRQRRAVRQGRRLRDPGRASPAWIEHIDGSYSGIMGLPLYETARLLLRRAGVEFRRMTTPRPHAPMQDILINWSPQETRVASSRTARCRSCTSSARWSAAWSATSTSARWRACCPACSRPSSTSAWSAPPSCTWPTSARQRRTPRGDHAPARGAADADREAWCSKARR